MNTVNDIMDDLEDDVKVIMVNGEPKTLREVLDSLLSKDKEEETYFSEG